MPGAVSLFAFAYLLTRVETEAAGRAYAAYGGVYIAASLVWLWLVEGHDRTASLGARLPASIRPRRPELW